MIVPAGFRGAAFGTAADGNGRDDPEARRSISGSLRVSGDWAHLRQVHGARVVRAVSPGLLGDGDAAYTSVPDLPMVVATADCYPVVVEADGAAGIAHAGWRGVAAGVVPALVEEMTSAGYRPLRVAIGPGIGVCCFEVGPEVADRFPGHVGQTTWGSPAVDLLGALDEQLKGLEVWRARDCTHSLDAYHSYRRDGTDRRQIGLAWVA